MRREDRGEKYMPRRTTRLLTAVAAMLVASTGVAFAAPVNEVEANDSIAQAQNIDNYFSLDADPNIGNSTTVPHATVIGTGNDTYDFYSFTVPQAGTGTLGVFDIDGAMYSFDSWLNLYNSSGSLIGQSDDGGYTDPGTVHGYDSYMAYHFPTAGTYYIAVGRYCCPTPVPSGGSYRLHVSVPGHRLMDITAPQLTLPDDMTHEATGSDGAVVTFTATASDEIDGSVSVSCSPTSGSVFPLGTSQVSCSATDAAGNTATGDFDVTVQDTTAPALTMPADITTTATGSSGASVDYTQPTATDLVDGPVPVDCTPASGSTFVPGVTTVDCSATDAASNQSRDSFEVHVLYGFTGFFAPIDNAGVFNTVKVGRAVPTKFSLSGDMGLDIFSAASPTSQPISCNTSAPQDAVEQTLTAGGSSLSYDASTDRYNYVWKTDAAWAGTCRVLTVTLKDGTQHSAKFAFTK
jgi:hypothetical protein